MKKAILTIGVVMLALLSSACSLRDVQDQVENVTGAENKYVLSVKNGYPVTIPEIIYGKAFDAFFAAPTWRYFKAKSGEDVVEFTGSCTYKDAEVRARLQFIISDDGDSFEHGALSFNDVPQSVLITNLLVYKAFEEYASQHDIEIAEEDNESDEGSYLDNEEDSELDEDYYWDGEGDNEFGEDYYWDDEEY